MVLNSIDMERRQAPRPNAAARAARFLQQNRYNPSARLPAEIRRTITTEARFRELFPGWATESRANLVAFHQWYRGTVRRPSGSEPRGYRRAIVGARSDFPNFDGAFRDVDVNMPYNFQMALFRHLGAAAERRRQNNIRRNLRAERSLIDGTAAAPQRYQPTNAEGVRDILERYRDAVMGGAFFVIEVDLPGRPQEGFYTLAARNFDDVMRELKNHIDNEGEDEETSQSDEQLADVIINNKFTIGHPAPRQQQQGRQRRAAPAGAYFPYLNTKYDCPEVIRTLNRIGCFTHIDENNYKSNCLCLAMQDAGVSDLVLADLEAACVRRTIPRKRIKEIAEKHKLRVTIHTFNDDRQVHVGPEDGFKVKLACYLDHYFNIFPTPINSWAIKNYDEIKHKPFWYQFRKKGQRSQTGLNSFKILRLLIELGTLEAIDSSTSGVFSTQFYDKAASTFKTLEYPSESVRLAHSPRFGEDSPEDVKAYSEQIKRIEASYFQSEDGISHWNRLHAKFRENGMGLTEQLSTLKRNTPFKAEFFVDFESTTDGHRHRPYLVSFMDASEDEIRTAFGETCGLEFLDFIADNYGILEGFVPTVQVKAHNITYDASFFLEYLDRLNLVERGVNIICGGGVYRTQRSEGELKVNIVLQDTQKIIIGPLARFSQMFKLDCIKEVMPYDLYTESFIEDRDGIADTSDLTSFNEFDELMTNLREWGCEISPGKWDMIKYGRIYCEADVRVLAEGWRIFQRDTLEHTGVDVNHVPTTASLAHTFITESGSYDGVYEISSVPRVFIELCIRGGRVCCADNKIHKFTDESLVDFDAVSLYPTAMWSMGGYPKGPPKVWNEMVEVDSVDDAFLEIEILDVGQRWSIPIYCVRTKEGNDWTDDLIGKRMHLDKCTLGQMQEHLSTEDRPFRYKIIQGYYFDEGFNTTISDTIKHLFDKRVQLKREGSPAQEGVKLLMNTAFGMTGRRADMTDVRYVEDKEITNFLHNHHNEIKIVTSMPNQSWRVVMWKPIISHFNKAHLACKILSYSKKIMNDLTCMVERECDSRVYYTDTDSMHLPAHVIPVLEEKYRDKFGMELIGKSMGQFHTDFDFKSCFSIVDGKLSPTTVESKGEIESVASYFMWKKSYIDKLNDEDGNEAYHIRLKGVPIKCILNKVNQDYGGDPMSMFEDFYQGEAVEFKLGSDGHVMFKTHKNHTIESVQMIRKVKFDKGRD